MSIRVLLADDQALVRGGFRLILEAQDDIQVVGEVGDGLEAVEAAPRVRPDVILMDIRMPRLDGIEATRRILEQPSRSPRRILMLTTFDLDEYVYEALRAGASGFLLKDVPTAQLAPAVRTVAAGEGLLAPTVTRRLIEEFARRPPTSPEHAQKLEQVTPRELDTLRLVARGLTNAEIASELFVSAATVKTHLGHLLMKLGVRDRVQAVVFAYESGLVQPGLASGARADSRPS